MFECPEFRSLVDNHNGHLYRVPNDLAVAELALERVLIIGSCFASNWLNVVRRPDLKLDFVLTNNFSSLPEKPPAPIAEYDFAIVQIPLRSVLHENTYSHLPHHDLAAHEQLLDRVREWLAKYLGILLQWNEEYGLTTFVANFLVPQQNPLGRLLPRNDLRNILHFVERVNDFLYEELARRKDVYLLDIDQLAASLGKKGLQDDLITSISHASILSDDSGHHLDLDRIQPCPKMTEHYPGLIPRAQAFYQAAWAEALGMLRSIRRLDEVKLVIVDLDDTLWRGVIAEQDQITSDAIEGWPVGLMEALCFLKKRGTMLAIASKNDESRITSLFPQIVGGRLKLEDFIVRKINWHHKSENVRQIMKEANVMPRNVVFIDDNPLHREEVRSEFPEIRTLGAHPYYLRRILLWAPEMQVAHITDESSRRTEMVRAQIKREEARAGTSYEDFLRTLELRANIAEITSTRSDRFPRALELINKTNQFNTTGQRWTLGDFVELFSGGGGTLYTLDLQDRFASYGLVGAAVVKGNAIEQFVMSCRVVGLDAEFALLSHICQKAAERGDQALRGVICETELNVLSRDLYRKAGFRLIEGCWTLDLCEMPQQVHSSIELSISASGH